MQTTLYTVAQVAQILHCNVTYVYQLIHARKLPAIKLGSYKIRGVDLDDFLARWVGYDLTDPENEVSFDDRDNNF